MIDKQVSPAHDQRLGDLGESDIYDESNGDYGSNPIYSYPQVHQTSVTGNYDIASCYTPSSQISDCTHITALRMSPIPGGHIKSDSFESKHPDNWNHANLVQWIYRVCELHNLDYQKLRLGIDSYLTGSELLQMSKDDVQEKFPVGGAIVYDALRKFLHDSGFTEVTSGYSSEYPQSIDTQEYWDTLPRVLSNYNQSSNCNLSLLSDVHHPVIQQNSNQLTSLTSGFYDGTTQRGEYLLHQSPMMMPYENELKCTMDSEGESNHSFTIYHQDNYTVQPDSNSKIPGRRKPGRPPLKDKKGKNGGQRNSRLWEFIRDLLLDSKTCPSLLKWENVDEGVFRFVNSEKVARLWGERKCNPRMTYEKLSRAMRYYYKSQVFQPVIGRRLVYKFGPNATGWRPDPSLVS